MSKQIMCSVCSAQPATCFFTDIINGVVKSRNLCSMCAQKMLNIGMSPMIDETFKSFDNMIKSFDDIFKELNLNKEPQVKDITCGDCGMTLSKFKQIGRFGCAKDYELFKVGPMLEKIHGTSVHMGKSPAAQAENTVDRIKQLQKDMEVAVKSEHYEKAAAIRDEIKKLEAIK